MQDYQFCIVLYQEHVVEFVPCRTLLFKNPSPQSLLNSLSQRSAFIFGWLRGSLADSPCALGFPEEPDWVLKQEASKMFIALHASITESIAEGEILVSGIQGQCHQIVFAGLEIRAPTVTVVDDLLHSWNP